MILIRVFLVIFLSGDTFCLPPALETTLALVLVILTGLVSALTSVESTLLTVTVSYEDIIFLEEGGTSKSEDKDYDGTGLPTSIAWILLPLPLWLQEQPEPCQDSSIASCLGDVIALLHIDTVTSGHLVQDGIRTIHIAVPIRNQVKPSFLTQLCANRASEKFCDLLQNRLR